MERQISNGSHEIEGEIPPTEGLLRSIECFFCNDRLTDPKEVDCGHVFCSACLNEYVLECPSVNDVTCPLCRHVIRLPETGVSALPTHVLYQDLVREVNALDNGNTLSRGSCKFCSDENKLPATVKCVGCKVPMCEDCASNHVHNGVNKVIPIHRKQDSILRDALPRRDTACPVHQTESVLFHCVTCQCCACYKCKDEKHQKHEVIDMIDAAAPAKTFISDIHTRVNDYINETKEALHDIERIGAEYDKNVDSTVMRINEQVDLLINHILKEKKRLLDELHSHAEDVESRLNLCTAEMNAKGTRAQALQDLTDNLVFYGTDAENTMYKEKIDKRWKELQEAKLSRFGQGYKMGLNFSMNERLTTVLSAELGTLTVSQTLSPWTSRKSAPFDSVVPTGPGLMDASELQKKMRAVMSNDFSLKRSQIFTKFVDSKWNLETYKTCKVTGQTVTVWLRMDEESENMSRASKRISMRSVSSPFLIAEVDSFDVDGEHEYKKTFEKLPDGTIVRLAIGAKDTIILAVYPGHYASSIISQAKLRSLTKKDTEGIYVAVLVKGQFVVGELRKIPIPEGPCFDFEVTSRSLIVVRSFTQKQLHLYNNQCVACATNHAEHDISVLKIMESPDNEIIAMCKDLEGNIFCETITETAERVRRFTFSSESLSQMRCEFREARFDRFGNVLVHFQASGCQDVLYQVTRSANRKELLTKPELLHKIDKLAVLPDGRLCVFDKFECVLITLKYL
ncbi:transcription intermediary factor 1-alpha-like [Dreissena polymorpha]|uniref:Uncharacterized protein n=1 Tax=Dreissena polymorpha TaxID=45954 RepID=A0A9D4GWR8_DREPO|nr:transcription intermediary factor 1-alpha-like [Dreissena polymorpha]XP_052211987.1 transcription intermediary factor 1-alpha-like [Dreissena polymorpha]XP_052211988.1 transcription intermediary factor 1-alpha-like [Dreissena polymorpha]KAH3824423.1 hypothetical protein DPMN_126259 [Dreissena polymorpha]